MFIFLFLFLILNVNYNPSFYESIGKTYFSIFLTFPECTVSQIIILAISFDTVFSFAILANFFYFFFLIQFPSIYYKLSQKLHLAQDYFFFYYNLKLSYLSHLFYMTVMRVLKWDSIFAVFQKCLLCCILFSNTLCMVPLISKGQMLIVRFSARNFHQSQKECRILLSSQEVISAWQKQMLIGPLGET